MSHYNSGRTAQQQSASYHSQDLFSPDGAILIVDTAEDAHAAHEHLGMEAFGFDRLAEQPPTSSGMARTSAPLIPRLRGQS
jgi:hypothetical protein